MKRREVGWQNRRKRTSAKKRIGDGRSRREETYFWAQLTAAILVVLGILGGVLVSVVGWTKDELGGGGGHIELVVATPLNATERTVVGDGGFVLTRATTPQVDLTVRNTGQHPVLLTQARITVEDSTWLPQCIITGAGPVPVAGRYAVPLPFLPGAGERTVEKPLHDEVPAGGVDRLKVYFGAPRIGEDDNLYALHVELTTDENHQAVDAGRFVLGVPILVSRNGQILPENEYLLTGPAVAINPNRLASTWCFRHNLAGLRRVLARPGQRAPEIAALSRLRLADGWRRYSDGLPARAAVKPLLLDTELSAGPTLAAFAAEQTGDSQLAKSTRKRAAAILLHRAESALGPNEDFPLAAVEDAHASLSLMPSSEGRELLSRAEAREREEREEQEEFVQNG